MKLKDLWGFSTSKRPDSAGARAEDLSEGPGPHRYICPFSQPLALAVYVMLSCTLSLPLLLSPNFDS